MIIADIPTIIDKGVFAQFCSLMAVPFFLICAGISHEFFIFSRLKKGATKDELSLELFFRAVILLIIVNVPFFFGSRLYPERFNFGFHWGVFQLIAAGYFFGIFFKRNIKRDLLFILIVFLLYHVLNIYYIYFFNFFLIGPFPALPFLAYFIVGRVAVGLYSLRGTFTKKDLLWPSSILLTLLVTTFLYYSIGSFYASRTNIINFSLLCGIITLLIFILHICVDNNIFEYDWLKPFERIGKIAFSSYYVFFGLELAIFPFINANYLIYFSKVQLSIIYFLFIASIVLSLAIIEDYWSKWNYKFGIEWTWRESVKLTMRSSQTLIKLLNDTYSDRKG